MHHHTMPARGRMQHVDARSVVAHRSISSAASRSACASFLASCMLTLSSVAVGAVVEFADDHH